MNIRIYQIGKDTHEKLLAFKKYAFLNLEALEHIQGTREINSSIYDCVYVGTVDCITLEDVYKKFNTDHPRGFHGHSLSVSDVVEITEAENVNPGFYYCDSFGFKEVQFEPEKAEPFKEKTIRVLMVEPGKKAYPKQIGTSLEELYKALDCDCIQTFYPYEDLVVIVCDDEGKINGGKPNRAIYDTDGKMMDIICGKFFICDCSTPEFKSLPDDMMAKYKKQFLLPERFARVNGEFVAVKYDPEREVSR